jgi:two-component system NarL family sensor kinase
MTEGLRYHATIPLYSREQPVGIMNVTSPSWRRLSSEELQILSTVAYQTGIAVERARLVAAETRAARAEERARIAREIHDTVAQSLTALGFQLEGALRALDADSARARDRLLRALELNREILEEARASVLELRDDPLPAPLPEAIEALGRSMTTETGIRVHVSATDVPTLPARVERELYRIAREALTNARLHSGASEVEVTLRARGTALELIVRDDGLGFDPRATHGRFGIVGMRERAHLLEGTLKVRSAPGSGTTVHARIPIDGDGA